MHTQPVTSKILAGIRLMLLLSFSLHATAQDFTNIKNAKPFSINGNIGVNSVFYNANGMAGRQAPFSYGFNANATASLYGVVSLPFSFVWYNQQQSNFNYPSFNRFGISPKYKWITGHFGHRSMSFSEYTLNGHTFLGAGVDLTPGKFRLSAMYGKFDQNSYNDPYMADSIPRFTRRGWAVKAGYGTDKSFVDVSILRIGDDTKNYRPPENPTDRTPVENLAMGVTTKVAITQKLSFSFDGAISVLTKNAGDPDLLNLTGFGTSIVKNLITVNMSSAYYTAFKTSLAYRFTDRVGAGVEYRRVDPEYQSLGAYFCNNDLEVYSFNANAGLLNNKLMLRGSLGIQRDNLGNTKKHTSGRTVGSFAGTYNISQNVGIDANYSNFSTNQRSGRSPLIDSLRLFQVNHTFSLMPRYTKVTASNSHFVMLNFSLMQLDDKNKRTAQQTETKTSIIALNYSLGFLKTRTNLTCGVNYTNLANNMYEGKMYSGSLGAAQSMLKDKLSLNWTNTIMLNKVGGNDGTTFNSYLSANYRPHPKHAFSLGVNYIKNTYSSKELPSFNEIRGELRYGYTF